MDTNGTAKDLTATRAARFDTYELPACPVEAALEIISGKWKGVALYHLVDGTKRFNELKRLCGTVTQRTLTKQLRELEADGMVERTVYAVVPPKVEYSLTPMGRAAVPALTALRDWGQTSVLGKEND